MLISTHDVDFAYRWAERAIVFDQGKIIADGTPLEIFKNQEVLEQANLKRPAMLDVYEMLVEKKMIKDADAYPTSPQALKKLLENEFNQS
ncbi:hypothetical protein DSECCO2_134230 [anaerobic digester metagenome]